MQPPSDGSVETTVRLVCMRYHTSWSFSGMRRQNLHFAIILHNAVDSRVGHSALNSRAWTAGFINGSDMRLIMLYASLRQRKFADERMKAEHEAIPR